MVKCQYYVDDGKCKGKMHNDHLCDDLCCAHCLKLTICRYSCDFIGRTGREGE